MTTTLIPIKTRPLQPPQDDLDAALDAALPQLQERDILVVTSKVVAISQGRCLPVGSISKEQLIAREAQTYIPASQSKYGITLSIKDNTLIASAGIDESNGNGHYILWPTNSAGWAQATCQRLKAKHKLKELAVIVTDSHCIPLRWGVVGISIGFYGLKPLHDYRGQPDIFGRNLHVVQGNLPDSIAAAAVGIMGEGDECTPAVLVRHWPRVTFCDEPTHPGFHIAPENDVFAPLLQAFKTHGQKGQS